jgi:hypothetical protein
MALVKAAKADDLARQLLPEMERAYQAGNYGRSGFLAQEYERKSADAVQRTAIRGKLESAQDRLRALQMRGVEQGAAPWRNLESLSWFAPSYTANSQAAVLDQFRSTNTLSAPDSVQAQLRDLQKREVDEMQKLTAEIKALSDRLATVGSNANNGGTWTLEGGVN